MPLHDSMPSFMNFRHVLDLLEFKNQASQCVAGNQRCPGVWNSFPFLAWDLNMHPRTHIWFFNQFICTGACACSSNLNYAHKCIENSANAWKCPNEPRKSQKITQHSCCSMLTREIFLKAIGCNGYRFVPKGGAFPTETIMLVVRSSRLWEAYTQTCPKWDKKFTTACWCCSMVACQVSWISDEFWIY